jgi:ABC-type multidrug transport system ATPase subunit
VTDESEEKPAVNRRPTTRKPAQTPAAKTPATGADGEKKAPARAPRTPRAKPAAAATPAATPVAKPATSARTPTRAQAAKPAASRKPAAPRTRKPAASKAPAATAPVAEAPTPPEPRETVLRITELTKQFGETHAVDHISLDVPAGTIFGIVGPNGAGKTTTLSMVTGLLRPDSGAIAVHGADVWSDPVVAKRNMGVLPDRLRLFDRLTGSQLLFYAGTLRGLDRKTVHARSADLAAAFGLEEALNRMVADYSAGMTKKIALACAMIHSPRLLVLDEPFESVDPVSAANVTDILQKYVAAGGTVVLSSHSMDLIQRICDYVAIVVAGRVLVSGTTDEVRGAGSLEDRFVELAGGRKTAEGMEWLHSFSD